jgi:hypothetical protein
MLRSIAFTAFAAGVWTVAAGAQPVARKDPAYYAGTERASRVEARPPGIRLGLRKPREIALSPLSASETARLSGSGPRLRIGIHRPLAASTLATGGWETTTDGARVWRMAIRSPEARGIRVEFRHFDVGAGKVWLHDGASQVAGPYTGRGAFGNGRFWSGTIFSESAILEYEPAPEAATEILPPFEIPTIAHRAVTISRAATRSLSPRDASSPDPADYCHLDPTCYPDWKPAMSMVARLDFEEDGDEYLCSGSAIATRDNSFKPYVLTAGHCIHSEDAARSLETFWTYQTQSCGGKPPDLSQSTQSTPGAHLIGYGTISEGDYSLVLLKDVPSGVTFSGWDTADPPLGTELTGVHHPVGSWKRISFGSRTTDETVSVDGATAPGDLYLEILWSQGRTEPGSSGSPLFSAPGVIVGGLTYGIDSPTQSACQISPSVDGYYRFSNAYAALKTYLEDLPSAEVVPNTASLVFNYSNGAAPAAQTVQLTTKSASPAAYKLRADAPWIVLPTVSGTLSVESPAKVAVGVDASQFTQPGEYASTVTILAGAAPPQYVDVTVQVQSGLSNPGVSISPNPVYKSGGLWSFTVRLAETGGVGTRITAMKMNAVDYTSAIQNWFGTSYLPANGSLAVPLAARGQFAPGRQYFEFWGTDDNGQAWYREATVSFQ